MQWKFPPLPPQLQVPSKNDHWWLIQKSTTKFVVSEVRGNGFYRRYVCRDCLVSTDDADNPDIGCERRKVSDVKKFLNKFLDKNAYPNGKLPCIPPEYCVS